MSSVEDTRITVGLDGIGVIHTKKQLDRIEVHLFASAVNDGTPEAVGVHHIKNPGVGKITFQLFPLVAGKQPGKYLLRAVGFRGTTEVSLGNFVHLDYDPINVSVPGATKPDRPQLSVEAFGAFGPI